MVARLLVIFVCISAALNAATPAMHHYTVTDGLPSTEVHCVFQDSRGKIWFGTDVGVSCYDGAVFTNYTTRDGLADHTIFGISEDRLGRIWFRGYNGLLCWFEGQKIVQPPVNAQLRTILKSDLVLSQTFDRYDTLWIGVVGSARWLKIPPGLTQVIEAPSSAGARIEVLELRPGCLVTTGNAYSTSLLFHPFGRTTLKVGEPRENIWASACSSLGDGNYCFQFGRTRYFVSGDKTISYTDSCATSCVYPCGNNEYWLCGQRPGGARLIRNVDGKEVLVKQYLADYDVTSCLRDHEGGLWFCTLENGVFYVPFPDIQDVYTLPLETGDHITTMTAWPGGGVLAGTLRGSLFIVDASGCTPWNGAGKVGQSMINCISTMGNKVLICGSGGSVIYDCITKHRVELRDPVTYNNNPHLFGLTLKSAAPYDARHWCAVSIRELYLIDCETGALQLLRKLPERIHSIARTRGDTLWLGGISRLWMYVPGQEMIDWSTRFPVLSQQADDLVGDTVSGRLWMLSRSGGVFAVTKTGVTDIQALQPALPLLCRRLLLRDGALWLATNTGVWELNTTNFFRGAKNTLHVFDRSNGLPANNVDLLCVSGDQFWVSGDNMLFRLVPGSYPRNDVSPMVCFRGIFCNGVSLVTASRSESEFRFTDNTFRFLLAGQSYKSCGHPRFLVRLLGADAGWRELEQAEITYYNLPPGNYRFMAYALNNSGVRSALPVQYGFAVLPPFWKRGWFVGLIAFVIIVAAGLLVRNYLQRFRRDETYHRTLAELEITALRAQMNPHFIFNAINSIYNFVLTGDRKASASYVARFAQLIRNVLEFTPQKQISLEQELDTLRLYMDIEQLRFREAFEYEIEVDPKLHPATVQIVPMLIQPYVENAIWHGLLHKEGKGRLRLSILKEENHLCCVIDDDGIGRAKAAEVKKPGIAKKPVGSLLTNRRMELLRELYGTGFGVQYIDKTGSETGTRVILRIPGILKN